MIFARLEFAFDLHCTIQIVRYQIYLPHSEINKPYKHKIYQIAENLAHYDPKSLFCLAKTV